MSNLAQEEADRILNYKPGATSHPEDSHDSDAATDTDDERRPRTRIIRSSNHNNDLEDQDTDDEDLSSMATMTQTRTYTVPSTAHFANTGPKGVIADAQEYQRARKSTFRRTMNSISDSLSFGRTKSKTRIAPQSKKTSSHSGSDLEISDDDEEFMARWREQRLLELQEQFSSGTPLRAQSPNRKTYGTLEHVSADGYLNAVENTPRETHVCVLLYNPDNEQSLEVEDELKTFAYKWNHVRFVKLHHEIAEMETVEIPAILAYRGGDVFATISGAEREGLEDVLCRQGVLTK